jgi:AcrR family transcriptional regulator
MPVTRKAPASGATRQAQKLATREALLSAAQLVLKRRGLPATTTREIAEEAGVAHGTFFVHFSNLQALIETLLDRHIEATLETAYRQPASRDLVGRLVFVATKLYASYDVEPDLSRAYIAASLFSTPQPGELTQRLARFRAWVLAQIDQAVAEGTIADLDRELAFTAFFSLYFGLLIAGLNGVCPRRKQLSILEAALRRLFDVEVGR